MTELSEFFDKTVSVVRDANLLAGDGGPIVMMQMENEYGNMENYYGELGHQYVQWAAQYALQMNIGIPWIMCQQGEGVGTAPPAEVINTCNGFYCDNWISSHAQAFPNQPHMWTENWPGWFQNWGQPIPHRPSVDVAFAVARWFARGGSYMNYYMAFGGSNFGRTVGGPLIVTSYDYDVHINEYAMRAEPKFSLLQQLHQILLEASPALLGQDIPQAESLSNSCEKHTYKSESAGRCIQFFSNWGELKSCEWAVSSTTTIAVPAWSVSIVSDADCSDFSRVFNTKINAATTAEPANTQVGIPIPTTFSQFSAFNEPIPSSLGDEAHVIETVASPYPLEQLSVTKDATDYLWYSTRVSVPNRQAGTRATMSFKAGGGGGGVMFVYADRQLVASTLGTAGGPPIVNLPYQKLGTQDLVAVLKRSNFSAPVLNADLPINLEFELPAGGPNVDIDVLSVSMGLQNYGPYLETINVGIVSNITFSAGSRRKLTLGPFVHSIGLRGEAEGYSKSVKKAASFKPLSSGSSTQALSWLHGSFETPVSVTESTPLALELSSAMGKGAIWVNGHMLGRYWNITAAATDVQAKECDAKLSCSSADYVGAYSGDRCRSGCGSPSQRYYKLPAQWLQPASSNNPNLIVVFEELGGFPDKIQLVEMSMQVL